MSWGKFFGWLMLALFGVDVAIAQDIRPTGFFLKDSIKIGQAVPYSLSYKDRKNRPVIFPDSLFDFSPFELLSKQYFNTRSDSVNSIDSAVYLLTTFEIDTVQQLSLPVFLYTGTDSLKLYSNPDSIILDQVVTQLPDSVKLAETSAYQSVALQFNYPYWAVSIIILVVTGIIVLIIWGKAIRKRMKLYRMSKQLVRFKEKFNIELEKLSKDTSKTRIEGILKFWKEYMERIEGIPYTKLTTKELTSLQQSASLEEALRSIDKNIYSTTEISILQNDFEFLKDYLEDRYHYVTNEIRNA